MEVVAIYFPNYHSYPHNDAWYGQGRTEWDLVKSARPRFEGHHQPLIPQWGYFDESDPAWSAREIDLASGYGIDVFLIDWYWYNGVQIMQEQLERGFLQAPNRMRMKFALMWANHSWTQYFPADPRKGMYDMPPWLPIRHGLDDLERVAEYCIEHYFSQPNYWTVGGKKFFSFYSYDALEKGLGGIEGVRQGLEQMDRKVRRAGLDGIHFGINISGMWENNRSVASEGIPRMKEAGFDSVFTYNIARNLDYNNIPIERPLMEYDDVIKAHEYFWSRSEGHGLPFHPSVTMGYDASPRWHQSVEFPMDFRDYPYEPIIINNTPEKFEKLCNLAVEHLERSPSKSKVLFVFAWNEWTESGFLLPEKRHGLAYLQALRKARMSVGEYLPQTPIKQPVPLF